MPLGITLDDPVQYLKGVGPARAADFARLGIHTVRQLLFTFPRDLSDRRRVMTIREAPVGEMVTLFARPLETRQKPCRSRKVRHVTTVLFADSSGTLEAVWFNMPTVLDRYPGGDVMLYGKIEREGGRLRMYHPQFEYVGEGDTLHGGRIVPIYPCTGSLTQRIWRRVMMGAIETCLPQLPEIETVTNWASRQPLSRGEAVRAMHFPSDETEREKAHARLVAEECLLMQLAILQARRRFEEELPGRSFRITPTLDHRIRRLFPFRLTPAQDRCIEEILADMRRPKPMHRLLQGDVGSGKTVVALYAMLVAVANQAQVCLMAPTALLARQHFDTVNRFLSASRSSKVRVALLAGGAKDEERERIRIQLAAGTIDILIATHAAISADIEFRDLGLIVIDEQHKFGVRQRSALAAKGRRPDILVMTATPIPRSLALTVYGDLDVSILDALPPGRKPVRTRAPTKEQESAVWAFVRRELAKGRQAYIVSPLLEESEAIDLLSAKEAFESLRTGELQSFRMELLHGRMSREEQRAIMDRFRNHEIDVLVSTVVIEVGVDVPNATLMVVLHAERFGLAQLHQLRGRIGRGNEAGTMILLSDVRTLEARRRLEILVQTSDGFRIAEEDLLLRGPGEFLGARQHGLPDLRLVDLVRDLAAIREARKEAENILAEDPDLIRDCHAVLRAELGRFCAEREKMVGVG